MREPEWTQTLCSGTLLWPMVTALLQEAQALHKGLTAFDKVPKIGPQTQVTCVNLM